MPPIDPIAEGSRIMTICNSCRYCEGFCPVFPAMERRLRFFEADMNYLANLCHNCAECYYACQYAPPHEFGVNVPQTLARIRGRSYSQYAWPRAFAKSFQSNGAAVLSILALSLLLAVFSALVTGRLTAPAGATFYEVVPHGVMVAVFGGAALFAATALVAGFAKCWRESGMGAAPFRHPGVWWQAARDALTLRHLDQDGIGCTYPDAGHSQARKRFHHFAVYGLLLCFASTTVAAIYHYGGRIAPYDYLSLPVVLGTLGGVGLLIGPVGLYALRRRRDPAIGDPEQDGMDSVFLTMLFLTSVTGLLLLVLRATVAMGPLLILHLAVVLALFLALPYGKFVHGLYRYAALLRHALETRE